MPGSDVHPVNVNMARPSWVPILGWRAKVLESRWATALGRSRVLCLIASVLFHITILLAFLITLPRFGDHHSSDYPSVVPIDLVTIGDETNMSAMVSHQLPFSPSDQQVEATSAPTKPEAAPSLEMKLFPAKPSEQQKPNTSEELGGTANSDQRSASSLRDAKVGDFDVAKVGLGTAMTMSASDFLRNQIALCWRRSRAAGPEIVIFELYLDGSGAIERPPRLVDPLAQTAEAIAAAESVRHAIYTCAPYRLPAERYREWRQVTLKFDPRMIHRGTQR